MAHSTQTIAVLKATAAQKEDSTNARIAELQALSEEMAAAKDTLHAELAAAAERAEELEAELKEAVESGSAAEADCKDKFNARCESIWRRGGLPRGRRAVLRQRAPVQPLG